MKAGNFNPLARRQTVMFRHISYETQLFLLWKCWHVRGHAPCYYRHEFATTRLFLRL